MNDTAITRSLDDAIRPPDRAAMRLDVVLLLSAVGLVACSLVTIASATHDDVPGQPQHFLIRQAVYAGIGFALMLAASRVDYSRLRELKYGLYGFVVSSILVVFALGNVTRGSKRWIDFPFVRFQPSELAKLVLILALAAFVVDRVRRLDERDTTARVMLMALIPCLLVFAQPDLGSGIVYIVVALAVLFTAGTSFRHFAALFVLAAIALSLVFVAAPAAGVHVLKPYQTRRLTAFMNPSDNPRDQGYQQNQSRIAIGSGQKTGRGAAHATQTKLKFLPEHHTDFIFAVVGEQFGFVGAALVLSLFAMMIWRGLRIVTMAKNLYGAVVAGGIVAMLLWEVFDNVGMTVGIMPITGVPLPLMSYGGSSVLVTFLALGLLQSIHVQARAAAAAKGRAALPF
ncbi:MAG TPA: rod shape-determining protein RodA [Solirubrobacteraceae bacterium]|nr:rod shape-determining protein RodA [Solirubrobacteraceae bacterium]